MTRLGLRRRCWRASTAPARWLLGLPVRAVRACVAVTIAMLDAGVAEIVRILSGSAFPARLLARGIGSGWAWVRSFRVVRVPSPGRTR